MKEWIASHNGGFLTPFVNGSFVSTSDEQKKLSFTVKNPFSGISCLNVSRYCTAISLGGFFHLIRSNASQCGRM